MAAIDCSIFLISVVVLCVYVLKTQNLQLNSISTDLLSGSKFEFISPVQLGLIRIFFGSVVWSVVAFLLVDKVGIQFSILQRNGTKRNLHLKNIDRFVMFTVWSWTIQGIYFTLAALHSFLSYFPSALTESKLLQLITWISFEISFPVSLLVSGVVTYVLIPSAKRANLPTTHFYKIPALLMHNANIIFMSFEIIVNRVPFVLMHFPFVLFYGVAYAIFSWIIFHYRGVFYYAFLDYGRKGAIFWYFGLMLGIALFFAGGYYLSYWLNQDTNNIVPYLVIVAVTGLMLKVKDT